MKESIDSSELSSPLPVPWDSHGLNLRIRNFLAMDHRVSGLNVCKLGMKEVVSHLAKIGRKWYAESLVAIWCCVPSGIGVPFKNSPSSWYGKLISWPVLDCEAVTPEEEKALKSGFMAKLQAGSVEPFVRKRGRTAMESVQIAWFYDPTIGLFGVGQGQKTELAHRNNTYLFSLCEKKLRLMKQ